MPTAPDMSIELASIPMQSPLIAAAGTCGYIAELGEVLDVTILGALTTKSITRAPRKGNDPWRMIELPVGMLNAIGLANVGLDAFLADKLPAAANVPTVVIGSIAGGSIEDYVAVASAFASAEHLPAVELNVSCPNTSDGLEFGSSRQRLGELLREVRPALGETKMFVKLSPNTGDIVAMADAAIESGADALTLINTVPAMAIDVETRQPLLSVGVGGMSGPAIHPIAVRMVHAVYRSVARDANVPIIGLGGVLRWQDAAELTLAGASAVGVGTALFVDPKTPKRLLRGLTRWAQRQGVRSIRELVGACADAAGVRATS